MVPQFFNLLVGKVFFLLKFKGIVFNKFEMNWLPDVFIQSVIFYIKMFAFSATGNTLVLFGYHSWF